MKYMGSKAKVARYIVPIIQEQIERSGYETYLEPFCGGCNVIDKIEAPQRIASDCNKYLIALMQHIQAAVGRIYSRRRKTERDKKLGHKIQRTDCDPCSSQANTPSRTASVRKSLQTHG